MQATERTTPLRVEGRLQQTTSVQLPSITPGKNNHDADESPVRHSELRTKLERLLTEDIVDSLNLPYLDSLFQKQFPLLKSRVLPVHRSPAKADQVNLMQRARQSIERHRLNLHITPRKLADSRAISSMDLQFQENSVRRSERKHSVRDRPPVRPSPSKNEQSEEKLGVKNRKRMHSYKVATLNRCSEELEKMVMQTKKTLHRNMLLLNNLEAKLMQ